MILVFEVGRARMAGSLFLGWSLDCYLDTMYTCTDDYSVHSFESHSIANALFSETQRLLGKLLLQVMYGIWPFPFRELLLLELSISNLKFSVISPK